MNKIGNQIKLFREQKGLSQKDLANNLYKITNKKRKNMKFTQQLISYWENGDRRISSEYLLPLSQILGVSIEELMGFKKL